MSDMREDLEVIVKNEIELFRKEIPELENFITFLVYDLRGQIKKYEKIEDLKELIKANIETI